MDYIMSKVNVSSLFSPTAQYYYVLQSEPFYCSHAHRTYIDLFEFKSNLTMVYKYLCLERNHIINTSFSINVLQILFNCLSLII